jgi:uncharacterized protein (TIGR04255 family)
MSAALGRLPNAPLAYVLAQVRFEPFLEIEKCIPALQTSLREHYPRFLHTEQVGYGMLPQPDGQPPRMQPMNVLHWEFGSGSNHEGVILQQHSLVFHVTAYETHEQFGQMWRWIMEQVEEQIPHLFVNRIGLRYIDFIIPKAGELPSNYVADRLRCDPDPGINYQNYRGLTLAQYELAGKQGHLSIRYSRGRGKPQLPSDLADMPLQPSAIMQRVVDEEHPTAVLDIDRFMALSMTYDVEQLAESFRQMQEDLSVAFKALTTDHARVVWSGEPL